MMPMSLTEIAQAVDGRLMPTTMPTDEPVAISAFTDSRQIVPGSVFVAIAGERVDGHDFVPKVGAQGAVAALVDHEIAGAQVPQIVVENTVKALGALAKHNIERRRALESPFTVIGITGSVGKTTTKDLREFCADYGVNYDKFMNWQRHQLWSEKLGKTVQVEQPKVAKVRITGKPCNSPTVKLEVKQPEGESPIKWVKLQLTSGATLFLRNTTVLDLSLLLNKMIG